MSDSQDLFALYQGHAVPRSFNAGFVTLSYVVSLIGAASTLELINRRTSRNGLFNHLLLFSAAVTMGGIAIWCMHFIGNRALELADGQPELQIAYSSGFTALSFFMPIMVLLGAFVLVGTNNKVSWWRIIGGGSVAGAAICGMHYLGNASIANYTCSYNAANVVGAALIAVAASIVALALFFVFRAQWTNSWWKRGASAIVLAAAVSGMHWTAAVGTHYNLVVLNSGTDQLSRNTTVVVVICLSVGAALIMAATAIWSSHIMKRYADKAQQVVVAAAVFDQTGNILVNPDGLLPSETITCSYIERTTNDVFNVAHPLFHWMFQASRNWNAVSSVLKGMANHIGRLPKNARHSQARLIDEHGQLIENYDIIFRELFCLAAANLADKMKEQLDDVGILYDEILPTGSGGPARPIRPDTAIEKDVGDASFSPGELEKGENWRARQQEYSRGSLMFLVRSLDNIRDVEKLKAAGYRFAEVSQVSGIIGSSMQIKARNLTSKLADMATYGENNNMMEPGVHVAFFGMKARVGSYGFDVLVKRGARNLLPTMPMPFDHLEPWQMDFIRKLDRLSVPAACQQLDAMRKLSPREMLFASQLYDTIEGLRAWMDDPIFDEAVFTAKVVQAPAREKQGSSSSTTCTLITLRMVIPIHVHVHSPKCEFTPLNFFKVNQLVYKNSPQHAAFSRSVHREIAPVINAVPLGTPDGQTKHKPFMGIGGFNRAKRILFPVDGDGNPIPTELGSRGSTHSGSTIKLWSGDSLEADSRDGRASVMEAPQAGLLGGIMVSQEIQVQIRDASESRPSRLNQLSDQADAKSPVPGAVVVATNGDRRGDGSRDGSNAVSEHKAVHSGPMLRSAVVESESSDEMRTFVDELFAICVEAR